VRAPSSGSTVSRYEGALALHEEHPAQESDPRQGLAHERRVLPEVLRDDGRLARRARMIAGVGEASQALEQDLELEQVVDLALERQSLQPRLACLSVLPP
jgi:hypothetical protein